MIIIQNYSREILEVYVYIIIIYKEYVEYIFPFGITTYL